MQHIYRLLAALTAVGALSSCEKELDFRYRDIAPLPVIEATLTAEGARVGITLTTPMDEPIDLTRLTDARVMLTDLTAGAAETLEAGADGFFTSSEAGVPGHDYRLDVTRGDATFTTGTRMYPAAEIRSLAFSWVRMPYDDVAVLKCVIADDSAVGGEYYWLKVFRNGEIYEWTEIDDRTSAGGEVSVVTMTSRRDTDEEDDDRVLRDGDVVTVEVCRISRDMHDYLDALQNDSNGPALFSGGRCLGYFMAAVPVSESIVFRPDEMDESGQGAR